MVCKCLKSCLCFWTKLKYYSSSLSKYTSESDSYSVWLTPSSSSLMQTDSLDVGDTLPSNHWILYFPSTKFYPMFSGKDGITYELKALYHVSLTSADRKVFFCNTRNHGGKQPPSIFLMFPFKTLSFLFGFYFFKKMSSRASSNEVKNFFCRTSRFLDGFKSCLNFSLTKQWFFQNRKSFFCVFTSLKEFQRSKFDFLALRLNEAVQSIPVNTWNPGGAIHRL